MFSNREIQEPLIVEQNHEIRLRNVDYKHQVIKRVIQFAGLFYLVFGVFIAYVWTSKELDPKSKNDSITYYFWDPAITTYSLGNLAVFSIIVLNKYWIYKATEIQLLVKPEINIIVCFMLIPLFLASSIFKVIKLVRDIAIIPCHGYMTFLEPLGSLCLLVGSAILIFDVRYYTDYFKDWVKRLLKSNLLFLTMIGITNNLIITMAMEHMNIFRHESENSSYGHRFISNEFCIESGNISKSLNSIFKKCDQYLRPIYLLFCICTLAYLIQLLVENQSNNNDIELEHLPSSSFAVDSNTSSLVDDENKDPNLETTLEQNVSYRLPSASLVLCITFLSLSLLNFIIIFSLRQKSARKWHRDLGGLIFCSFISIVYILGSALSAVHIFEIKRWPILSHRRGNIIDKCLIWIGAGGQIAQSMTSISKSFVLLVNGSNDEQSILTPLLFMLIVSSILVISQTFLQTIQISLFLDRRWKRPEINSWAESLCPAIGMMGLNMGLLLLSLDHLTSPILAKLTHKLFVDLFVSTLASVGETLSILQRLHASLLFASMIIYTHN